MAKSPASSAVIPATAHAIEEPKNGALFIAIGVVLALVVGVIVGFGTDTDGEAKKKSAEQTDRGAGQEAPREVEPVEPEPPSLAVEFVRAEPKTLTEAVGILKPHFVDTGVAQEDDNASLLLASWLDAMGTSVTPKDFTSLPSTTGVEAIKDIESARGKYFCLKSTLLSIEVDRSVGFPIAKGRTMGYPTPPPITFIAAGSTGSLLTGSPCSFCGVVTGLSGTGMLQSVRMVGMFRL